MLELKNIGFDYPDKPLFQCVNFIINPGQVMHLRGRNGAGKTTLLRIIAGILPQEEGNILFREALITENLSLYQQQLCYVGHKTGINNSLSVAENCKFDLHYGRKQIDIDELLQAFAISDCKDTPCHDLSAGQRRRVGLLRLFMTDACLWILDEPLVALDKSAIAILMDCISAHLSNGGMLVVTSHQPLPLLDKNILEHWL